MTLATDIILAAGSVAAAIAAAGSWRAATLSNRTSRSLAAIESSRRHEESAPIFRLDGVESQDGENAYITATLAGGSWETVQEVVLTILDETGQDRRSGPPPDGVTQDQYDQFLWSRWEFNAGASEQVVNYRESRPRTYSWIGGKDWDYLHLKGTHAGGWMSDAQRKSWRTDRIPTLRVLITAKHDTDTWHQLHEVTMRSTEG